MHNEVCKVRKVKSSLSTSKCMHIEIDQSGKIEDTSHDTVVAYSNGKQKSLLIKAEEKRILQQVFREAGKPHMFAVKTFAVLVYLLVRDDLEEIEQLTIDREYVGYEWLIKQVVLQIVRRRGGALKKEEGMFWSVGKQSRAHVRAIAVYRGNQTPDVVVKAQDVLPYVL